MGGAMKVILKQVGDCTMNLTEFVFVFLFPSLQNNLDVRTKENPGNYFGVQRANLASIVQRDCLVKISMLIFSDEVIHCFGRPRLPIGAGLVIALQGPQCVFITTDQRKFALSCFPQLEITRSCVVALRKS